MQNTSDKYLELLDDERFIEWILFPTDELDDYWSHRISNDPELAGDIELLTFIIKNLQIERKQLSPNSKSRILNNLPPNSKQIPVRRLYNKFIIRIAASAAVILLIFGSIWLLINERKPSTEIDYQSILTNHNIDEQSENIELILDHKNSVRIDSTAVASAFTWNNGTNDVTETFYYDASNKIILNSVKSTTFKMKTLYVPQAHSLDNVWSKEQEFPVK